jgi:8-oxo-dGTP diphosphatase
VCIRDGLVLLALCAPPAGEANWTLPGGKVEHGEDPFDAVIREVAEETGCQAEVQSLLGVDSRTIPAADRPPGLPDHHNVGIFYRVRITGGTLRPEPDGDVAASAWTPTACRSRAKNRSPIQPRSSLRTSWSAPACGPAPTSRP